MLTLSQDPITYAIPLFVVFTAIELFIAYKEGRQLFFMKDSLASVGMGLGSVLINLVVKVFYFGVFVWLHQFALFNIGWQWWAWVLLLFADDFTFYWHHRMSHQVRLLWAAHVNHHSSQYYNLTTAVRQSWTELLYKYAWWCWLPLLGFEPLMMMIMISISLIYQFFLHTETVGKLGFIEWFMNTPSHHRVHHATNIKYLDKNHAGIFIIWDRLFGTFQAEDEAEKPIFGITNNINTYNLLEIASHEFVAIGKDVSKEKNWWNKLKYLLMPPGWSASGENKTSAYLQQQGRQAQLKKKQMS